MFCRIYVFAGFMLLPDLVNFVVTNNAVHKLSRCILRQGTNGVISCRRTHLQSVAEQATIRRDDKTSSLGIVACQTLGARWTYAFAGFMLLPDFWGIQVLAGTIRGACSVRIRVVRRN